MGDRKFIIALVLLLVVYVWYEVNRPTPEDWSLTFHHESTEPFGAEAMQQLMAPMFSSEITNAYKTLYELYEEDSLQANNLILAAGIGFDEDDTELILNQVEKGRTIFMSALGYGGVLADTFGLESMFEDPLGLKTPEQIEADLSGETTTRVTFDADGKRFSVAYPALGATNSFEPFESDSLEVLAYNDEDRPVLVRYKNNGQLILSTLPLSFTNYFTLLEETTALTEAQLMLIPQDEPLIRNQYYHLGRLESGTPFRVLLSNDSLRWALYLVLLGVLVFFVIQSKREQRIIPVITPLSNLTLEFVRTLGRLYYRQSDHSNLSHKRVLYWKEFVRNHYNLPTAKLDEEFIDELSKKSGRSKENIKVLVRYINTVETDQEVSASLLLQFEKELNEFYGIE